MSRKRVLDRFPRTLELLSNGWKNNEYTKYEIQKHCDSFWSDDDIDCIRFQSRKLFDVIEEMIEDREDIEDNMCSIYYNLETKKILGPFSYYNDEENDEANKLDKCKTCILLFAK